MTAGKSQQDVVISKKALSFFMPLHILINQHGQLQSAGALAQKFLLSRTEFLDDVLELTRPTHCRTMVQNLHQAAQSGERIEMRLRQESQVKLRGHVALTEQGEYLLNFGFGMFLHDAVSKLGLSDSDFPPSTHVMEYMFLYEANCGVMQELSLFNRRLKNAHAMAEKQARTDALTGVQNRRGLLLRLKAALDDIAHPSRSGFIAIAQIDLDHFKLVNDRFGHAAGDTVLRHVAKILNDSTRAEDTVARIGGDEFVLILRSVDDPLALERLGKRIIKLIENPLEFEGTVCQVSASIGIVMVKATDDLQIDKILADADAALYASKENGRGRTKIVSPSNPE